MLTLYLVRHGQTDWNAERRVQGQSDSVLDDKGREQAEQLRPTIEKLGVTSVYTSSNVRTQQTAEILAGNLPMEPTLVDGLREIHLGHWEKRLWDEIIEDHPEHVKDFLSRPHQFCPPGAETFAKLQQRGVGALEQIIEAEKRGVVLVVSHGAILRTILAHYAGIAMDRLWEGPPMSNCCVSIINVNGQGDRTVIQVANTEFAHTDWAAN